MSTSGFKTGIQQIDFFMDTKDSPKCVLITGNSNLAANQYVQYSMVRSCLSTGNVMIYTNLLEKTVSYFINDMQKFLSSDMLAHNIHLFTAEYEEDIKNSAREILTSVRLASRNNVIENVFISINKNKNGFKKERDFIAFHCIAKAIRDLLGANVIIVMNESINELESSELAAIANYEATICIMEYDEETNEATIMPYYYGEPVAASPIACRIKNFELEKTM